VLGLAGGVAGTGPHHVPSSLRSTSRLVGEGSCCCCVLLPLQKIVTGCTFAPNDDNLLISCGEDGLLACTDRRSHQVRGKAALQGCTGMTVSTLQDCAQLLQPT
jgi:hypothetical protein